VAIVQSAESRTNAGGDVNDGEKLAPGLHPDDDTCTDLVLGLLPDVEAESILEHLENCRHCEEHFQKMAADWEVLTIRAHIGRLGDAAGTKSDRTDPVGSRARWRALSRPRLRLAVAGVVALTILLWLIPGRPPDTNRDLLGKLPVPGTESNKRTDHLAMPEELSEGLVEYDRGNFEAAAALLSDVSAAGPTRIFRDVYLGNALAWTGRYRDAVQVLNEIPLELVPEPWSGEARWTLYVALRGAGQIERADSLFQQLQIDPGIAGDRARELSPGDE
jgi:hypothetical protein